MTTTSTPANLTTATPAEIDAALFPLLAKHEQAVEGAHRYEKIAAKEALAYRAEMYREQAAKLDAEAADLAEKITPFHAEWARRGGWTRAYLCTANNGHLHRTMSCSTTYVTTGFANCPELSGMADAEVVDLAGERACTVCYPDAPVDALKRQSRLAWDVADRAAKAERDAELAVKRAAKAAKAITALDGSPLRVTINGWAETVATVATAWKLAVEGEADHLLYGYSYGADHAAARATLVEALAVKLGRTIEDVEAEVAKKVAAKVKRG